LGSREVLQALAKIIFIPGYSYENQVVRVCQDIADLLDEGFRTHRIIINYS
jgi:hypothetical protein